MTMIEVDSARLRSEIAAFYAGFGVQNELTAAFDESTLLVPLSGPEDRVYTLESGGVAWLCAFTGVREYAQFMHARRVVADQEYRFHTFLGRRLREFAERQQQPVGVAVDMSGTAPMVFPPAVSEEPSADTGRL
ncbi:SseB family protein [Nocardia caishijiensis]|uniref:Type III secretion system (T3SS) SseB-like protein n=1 Tax=Nocardia caishijiensis TaxID=184756 RepID=A0ABQ6YSP8_9NOCA|nr:SseB family protein [Nocardia caishijiensis]KAF0848799.1 type III secretion system (T3SS) SseB-like protein [Nocardia caishijiensis]